MYCRLIEDGNLLKGSWKRDILENTFRRGIFEFYYEHVLKIGLVHIRLGYGDFKTVR